METKALLYGLIGFFIGGFIVAVAANRNGPRSDSINEMTMENMTLQLKDKSGDEYDKAFLQMMIVHHQGAVEMAKLSKDNAKHEELGALSDAILSAQEHEIRQMKQWQSDWGYTGAPGHTSH